MTLKGKRVLGLFAKYWNLGKVKTRLAAKTSDEFACRVHRLFLATTLSRFRQMADSRHLVFAPANSRQPLVDSQLCRDWTLTAQCEGDLGRRMCSFLDQCIRNDGDRVVLIGADSPHLPAETIEQAFESLQDHEVVIGPSDDGGYYLIGMTVLVSSVFENIAWSTATVFDHTVERLKQLGHSYEVLPSWYDVDELSDLERLAADLETSQHDPSLACLKSELAAITATGGP